MNKLEGFQFRWERARRTGACIPRTDPYDEDVYRHRCLAYYNSALERWKNTPQATLFRQEALDREVSLGSGYCLDAPL